MAGAAITGCAKTTDPVAAATATTASVSTANAKVTFEVAEKVLGYSDPQQLKAAGITQASTSDPAVGTVVCDDTSFNVADIK